jgi:hypothetical protein
MDDFRPGKPGSEEVKSQLDYYGLFLLDGDLSYDSQALKSIQASLKSKKDQYDGFVKRLRDSRISTGSPVTEESMEEAIRAADYDRIEDQVIKLKKREEILRKTVSAEKSPSVKEDLDPKKTCFVTDPPRQFASETALKMFLSEQDAEFVKKHEALQRAMLGEDKN